MHRLGTKENVFLYQILIDRVEIQHNKADCVAILMTGDMRIWHISLNIEEKELAEEKINLFKKNVALIKNSFSFVFYLNSIIASVREIIEIFRKHFSNSPLIGCSSSYFQGYIYNAENENITDNLSVIMFIVLTYN